MSRVSQVSSSRFAQELTSNTASNEAQEEAVTPASSTDKASGEWQTATEQKQDTFSSQAQQEQPQSTVSSQHPSLRTHVEPRATSKQPGVQGRPSSRSSAAQTSQPPVPQWLQNSGLGQQEQLALQKSLQQKPECAAGLQSLFAHPQFASQDEKTKMMLATCVFANKGNRAQGLLDSQDFQGLTQEQKHQACHMLLTSSHFQASRISDAFEKLDLLKKEFQRLDPKSQIGRASLANTVGDILKTNPEVFQLLGVKERLSAMHVMLGQLGTDRDQDTQSQRTVLQALQSLKTDNPASTNTVMQATLKAMKSINPWEKSAKNAALALGGQILFGRIPEIPSYILNKAYSIGTSIVENDGVANTSGGYMEAILSSSVGTWLASATRMGNAAGWAVTAGFMAFEEFKQYVAHSVNQSDLQHAEQLLQKSRLMP